MSAVFPNFPASDGKDPGVVAPYAMPLAVPAGILSWELTTLLATNQDRTSRVPLKFSTSFVLTGFLPTIVYRNPAGGLPEVLSPAHLWVALDIDQRVFFTVDGSTTSNAAPGGNWVTLESISALVRLYNLRLNSVTPELGASFRSKHGTAGASGLPADVRISLTVFGYEVDNSGSPVPLVR